MKYRPKLNPDVDLKGATPEALARALMRPTHPHSRARAEARTVVGDQVGAAEPAPDRAGDDMARMRKGV